MQYRAFLLATSLLYAAPAFAVVDPPAASINDARMRTIVYDQNNPVELYVVPGASLRLQLGADESVVQIVASDQNMITPDPASAPPPAASGIMSATGAPGATPPSCDPNLCRSVVGNFVYLKPLRALDPQPLFIQTQRVGEDGRPEMVPYTFELLTRHPVLNGQPAQPMVWGLRFIYPDRERAAKAAAWLKQKQEREEAAREAAALAAPPPLAPDAKSNWRYGYRGAASVQPDEVWDDGRSTFLRFNGNRRVPNIYNQLPDGHESIPAVASTPDETGNTIKIAHTETKWFIRDGDEAGCLFDLGPDPVGATTATVADVSPITGSHQ